MVETKKTKPAAVRKRPGKNEGNLEEAIARKAYEIFEERGREHGKDLEHWLEAEAIIMSVKKPK
jgi:hypothetical protein